MYKSIVHMRLREVQTEEAPSLTSSVTGFINKVVSLGDNNTKRWWPQWTALNREVNTRKYSLHLLVSSPSNCTVIGARMSHWKWRETKHMPSRASSGHQISCCLFSLHFLYDILAPITVYQD